MYKQEWNHYITTETVHETICTSRISYSASPNQKEKEALLSNLISI